MVHDSPRPVERARLFGFSAIGRDYALLLPGFVLSLFAFIALVPLAVLSISTLIIWVGALLLPFTLRLASFFASLSRARLRAWGADVAQAGYAPRKPGMAGLLGTMADSRRWLDLAFETLVAFPLRTFTFTVAISWGIAAIGQLSYPIWGVFLPRDDISEAEVVLQWLTQGALADDVAQSFWLDATFNFVTGCLLLIALPAVLRGLVRLEIAVTTAGLGDDTARGWARIASGVLAILAIAVGWPILAAVYGVPVVTAMCIVLAHAIAFALAGRLPLLAIALQLGAVLASLFATVGAGSLPWPWPATTLVFQTLMTLLIALRCRWPWAIAAWGVPQLGALIATLSTGVTPGASANMIVSASISLGLLVLCIFVRQLVTSRGALQAERRTSAGLSAQSRELAERNRIAQELHDVVAHSMSVISVQATTAKYRLPEVGDDAEREFESIAASSRQALAEMRSLLALLRTGGEGHEALLAPQPTIADVPALVAGTRQSGASVSLHMSRDGESHGGELSALPTSTGLTVYRIVQEALSNAVRHSPGSDIDVRVLETDREVIVEVRNGAPDRSKPLPEAPGAGLGLAGVRERVSALGGSVKAGPRTDGGFSLRAVLPVG